MILGGGPCGVTVAQQLMRGTALTGETGYKGKFHVTIVDRKEFYEHVPDVVRLWTDENSEELWQSSCIPFADILQDAGELVVGTVAAVRRDHVLVGTTSGIASKVVPFDFLVMCTGSSYKSDIKTEGTSIEHRKRSFALERERIRDAPAVTVVGGGLVGCEIAFDIKSFFPSKPVHVITRAEGFLPRVPGAHDLALQVATDMGLQITKGKSVSHTNDQGQAVTYEGEVIGDPDAMVVWATGYSPNTQYLSDPRTDPAIAACLDDLGFVRTQRTQRLAAATDGLSHIFVGGDICDRSNFSEGERTAGAAGLHAEAIIQNILLDAGVRAGEGVKEKKAIINAHAGLDGAMISLGKDTGLLYATSPAFESFFTTAEALKAERGTIAEAGTQGWLELSPQVNYVKFSMIPPMYKNMLVKDDMTILNMFHAAALTDVDDPDKRVLA